MASATSKVGDPAPNYGSSVVRRVSTAKFIINRGRRFMNPVVRGALRINHRLKSLGQFYMLLAAVVVGVVGGYGAIAFRYLIHWLQDIAWLHSALENGSLAELPWYWILIIPAVGGLIAGAITDRWAPEAGGHGVPEVMEAVALRGGRIRLRVLFAKLFASAATIASGGSVGREGPIVQIGASAGSSIGQMLGLNTRRMRTLVGCGAAAGISATFNAPVAGAFFAVEILMGDFGVPQFSPIVVSSVIATVVSRHYLGDSPTFDIPEYSLNHSGELIAYVVLGLVAAVVGVVFIRSLDWAEERFERMPTSLPVKAAFGGAMLGTLALAFPGVLGVGYDEINHALAGESSGRYLVILLVAKMAAVCITLASGGSGGVFAPSLFMGAAAGGAVGAAAQALIGVDIAEPGAYALVGMGAMVAATTHAPVMAILVIFELTGDYRIILPLMLSCIIATVLASALHRDSIYTAKLTRRGVRIRGGRALNVLSKITAGSVMHTDLFRVSPGERLPALLDGILGRDQACMYVVSESGKFEGVITLNTLRPVLQDSGGVADVLVARDLASRHGPQARRSDTLDTVLGRLASGYRDEIPVVEDGQLIGAIRTEDVLACYRRELLRREMAESVAVTIAHTEQEPVTYHIGDFAVEEHPAPKRFFGQTIGGLDVRQRFGVTVLLVRAGETEDDAHPEMPDADYEIQPGDRLVVFGPRDAVARMRLSKAGQQPPTGDPEPAPEN